LQLPLYLYNYPSGMVEFEITGSLVFPSLIFSFSHLLIFSSSHLPFYAPPSRNIKNRSRRGAPAGGNDDRIGLPRLICLMFFLLKVLLSH
jgi:hypothetical protein